MPRYAANMPPEVAKQFEQMEGVRRFSNPLAGLVDMGIDYFTGRDQEQAAREAADLQYQAAQDAMDLQRQMYEQSRADHAPWLQAGQQTLADLMRQMQAGGFEQQVDSNSLAADPGFQFRMAEGQKALERSAAARGGLNSGGTLKSLARYSQGVASDEYQRAFDRSRATGMDRYNRLANLAGVGQSAAQNLGGLGGNYANAGGTLYGAMGNAQSAGVMGAANARAEGRANTLGGLMALGTGMPMQPRIPTQQGGDFYDYPTLSAPVRY